VKRALRSIWSEPRPPTVPRGIADWRLVGALAVVACVEVAVRDDLRVASPSFLLALALVPTLLWRRSHPLLVTSIAFVSTAAYEGIGIATGRDMPDVSAQVYMLVLPYALCRWGSGREALVGVPVILASASVGFIEDDLTIPETLGGLMVLLAPIAIGTAVRYREAARLQELVDVRASERLGLARELHDTVAHHVSAIAVRAQAGLATSSADPNAATEALRVIGEEASRTLDEMREMVRVLRDGDAIDYAPAPRLEDLVALQDDSSAGLRVDVALEGDTEALSPAVTAALYRLAQESVTNARRHARGATTARVRVSVDPSAVRLRVEDDGAPATARNAGFGLLGMAERAQLMGGTLRTGPGTEGGWIVDATLPRSGAEPRP